MKKVVGWSVSKLKQREEAKAGEEGEKRNFGKGSSSCSISPAPVSTLFSRPNAPVAPGIPDPQAQASLSPASLLQVVQRQLFTHWSAGKFQFSTSAKQHPSSKYPPSPPLDQVSPGKLGVKGTPCREHKMTCSTYLRNLGIVQATGVSSSIS